ncbi:MAG: TetR/AcrR family transcriptional regulator [Lentisphaeraceae bacterium]|nr:TetR/AcrR family transcriptional regulator [Lentisphaeraceae bacterium]
MQKNKDSLIIKAALQLFKTHGFASVRIADIAKEAGIGKGTVYEYFSSKEDLLLKACSHFCQTVDEDLETVLKKSTSLTNPVKIVHKTLETVLTRLLIKSTDEKKLFYELSTLMTKHPELKEAARADFQMKLAQWQGLVKADYLNGLEQGYFRFIETPEDLAEFIVATVDGLIWQMQWQTEEKLKDQAQRMADVYCQLILNEPQRLQEFLT